MIFRPEGIQIELHLAEILLHAEHQFGLAGIIVDRGEERDAPPVGRAVDAPAAVPDACAGGSLIGHHEFDALAARLLFDSVDSDAHRESRRQSAKWGEVYFRPRKITAVPVLFRYFHDQQAFAVAFFETAVGSEFPLGLRKAAVARRSSGGSEAAGQKRG